MPIISDSAASSSTTRTRGFMGIWSHLERLGRRRRRCPACLGTPEHGGGARALPAVGRAAPPAHLRARMAAHTSRRGWMRTPTPAPGPEGQHDPVGGGAGSQAPAPGWSGRPDQGPGGPNQYGQYGQYGQSGQSGQSGQYGHDGQDAQHGRDGQRAPGPQGGSAPTPPAAGAEQGWGAVPEIPRYGGEPSSSYGQYGAPGEVPTMATAQPGIIPLRPLTLGEIYDGAFKAIRANPAVMFGLAAVVVAIVTFLQGALTWGAYEDLNRLAGEATPTEEDLEELVGALGASVVPSLAGTVLGFVATTILNGVLIHSVSQSVI